MQIVPTHGWRWNSIQQSGHRLGQLQDWSVYLAALVSIVCEKHLGSGHSRSSWLQCDRSVWMCRPREPISAGTEVCHLVEVNGDKELALRLGIKASKFSIKR